MKVSMLFFASIMTLSMSALAQIAGGGNGPGNNGAPGTNVDKEVRKKFRDLQAEGRLAQPRENALQKISGCADDVYLETQKSFRLSETLNKEDADVALASVLAKSDTALAIVFGKGADQDKLLKHLCVRASVKKEGDINVIRRILHIPNPSIFTDKQNSEIRSNRYTLASVLSFNGHIASEMIVKNNQWRMKTDLSDKVLVQGIDYIVGESLFLKAVIKSSEENEFEAFYNELNPRDEY